MGQLLHDHNEELGYRLPLDRSMLQDGTVVARWDSVDVSVVARCVTCCKMCEVLPDGTVLQDVSVFVARWVGVVRRVNCCMIIMKSCVTYCP